MTVTVDEAFAVLEQHANTARSRAALSTLKSDFETPARERAPDNASRRKPRFPTKETLDEIIAEKTKSAKGGHSLDEAKGDATARKGT